MLDCPPMLEDGIMFGGNEGGRSVAEIFISQHTEEERFQSQHWIITPLADNRYLLNLTGIVVLRGQKDQEGQPGEEWYKGTTSDEWRRDNVHLIIKFPPDILQFIPPGKSLEVESAAPLVTINSIYNEGEAVNAGWGVEAFSIQLPPDRRIREGVQIWALLAVRDSDGYLFRIGYDLTLYGQLKDQPPAGPPG